MSLLLLFRRRRTTPIGRGEPVVYAAIKHAARKKKRLHLSKPLDPHRAALQSEIARLGRASVSIPSAKDALTAIESMIERSMPQGASSSRNRNATVPQESPIIQDALNLIKREINNAKWIVILADE